MTRAQLIEKLSLALLLSLNLLLTISLSGCHSSSVTRNVHLTSIHSDLSLGEFLQKDKNNQLLTFVRDTDNASRGLVRINPETQKIDVIDADAVDGKDLFVLDEHMIYRRGSQIYVVRGTQSTIISDGVEKIRAAIRVRDEIRIFVDLLDHRFAQIIVGLDGEKVRQTFLTHSIRFALSSDNDVFVVSQTDDSLYLSKLRLESDELYSPLLIEQGRVGDFVSVKLWRGEFWIAYLDSDRGLLRLARVQPNGKLLSSETVDGETYKTMRGMDIEFFEDGHSMGILYLDAWALRLRMARLTDGVWNAETLPIRGSVGFYTKVLNQSKDKLMIAFHSYRSEGLSLRPSFEDLNIAEIDLN